MAKTKRLIFEQIKANGDTIQASIEVFEYWRELTDAKNELYTIRAKTPNGAEVYRHCRNIFCFTNNSKTEEKKNGNERELF